MKLNQIALAVATLAAASPTFALTPSQVDGTTARLWLSGSSSIANSVFQGMMQVCRPGDAYPNTNTDIHVYLEKSSGLPGNAGDRMAYTCTVWTYSNYAGSLENQKIVVYHTVEGGSFNAYAPHLKIIGDTNANLPSSLKRIKNVESLGATGQCAAGASSTEYVKWYSEYSGRYFDIPIGVYRGCATTIQNFTTGQALRATVYQNPDRPEGGFSDTEYVINKLNLDVTTELDAIGSEVLTNIGQVFGVAVSYPLYYQLQKNDIASGDIAATCDDAPFTSAAPNLTSACQPNLPAQRYTSIANADSIGGVDGTLFGAAATPPGTSGKIQLHRSAITSGTQSASNLRFLNKPCAMGVAAGALNPARDILHDTATVNVTENFSTVGVKTGLTNATNAGEFGLGVVSMENVPAGTDKYAFVKLNGMSPNSDIKQRANAMNGSYDMWYELVAFTSYNAFPEGVDLISAVNTSLGNPGITDLTGLFITPASGYTGASVGKGFRVGNSCQPAVQ